MHLTFGKTQEAVMLMKTGGLVSPEVSSTRQVFTTMLLSTI